MAVSISPGWGEVVAVDERDGGSDMLVRLMVVLSLLRGETSAVVEEFEIRPIGWEGIIEGLLGS